MFAFETVQIVLHNSQSTVKSNEFILIVKPYNTNRVPVSANDNILVCNKIVPILFGLIRRELVKVLVGNVGSIYTRGRIILYTTTY